MLECECRILHRFNIVPQEACVTSFPSKVIDIPKLLEEEADVG